LIGDVIHHEFVLYGRTVSKEYYLKIMKNLREAARRRKPGLSRGKKWRLHPDSTQAHASILARYFLKQHETTLVASLRTRQTLHQRTYFSSPS
jgi:hypothetical protein